MEVALGIVFFGHLGEDEILFLQVVRVDFAALHHQARLLEDHVSTVGFHGCEARLGSFVVVPTRSGAAELQGRAVLFGKEGEGIFLVRFTNS